MFIKEHIIENLKIILKEFSSENLIPEVSSLPAQNMRYGEYSTAIAMQIVQGSSLDEKMEIAEKLKEKYLKLNDKYISKVEVAKPGFINFSIAEEYYLDYLTMLLKGEILKELQSLNTDKKIVVEYSSPNIAKPFTVGHLRSTIIGDAIANLLEATGWKVYRDNHIGDWGTQFGKQIAALKYIDLGTGKVDLNDNLTLKRNINRIEDSERPVKELVDLYIKFHKASEENPKLDDIARAEFVELENNNKESRLLWQKCIDWSWKEFEQIYKQLGVPSREGAKFENNNRGYGESYFENKMKPIIDELKEKKLLKIGNGKEGATIVEFEESKSPMGKLPPLMILKKDGSTLYSTRDLATDRFRLQKYGKDIVIINEVGSEQSLYFKQLKELEVMLGWIDYPQKIHVKHGLFRFKEGKMSTRKGNVIWLEDVLVEAIKRAYDLQFVPMDNEVDEKIKRKIQKTLSHLEVKGGFDAVTQRAEQVGIGALKWNDLKRNPEQDIAFDWDEMLNMQGNSGPYMQYTYARTQSVLRKSKILTNNNSNKEEVKLQVEEIAILRLLVFYPDVIQSAAKNYSPNILCTYLFELAQAFNAFYQNCPILKAEKEVQAFRLVLTKSTGEVLKQGLNLLGIEAPERM